MNRLDIDKLILHESEDYIILNKPATMSVVYDKTNTKTLQGLVEDRYKRPVHPITRLDKVVSGACIFARSKESAQRLTDKLSRKEIDKKYVAVVEGKLESKEGNLSHFLRKKGSKTRVSDTDEPNSKKASLSYKVTAYLDNYSVVIVTLDTGRFHQIRALFSAIGHPIKGDVKYGARRKNRDRSIHLHSWKVGLDFDDYYADLPTEDNLWLVASQNLR